MNWRNVGRRLSRHTVIVLSIAGLATLALLVGARQLDFETGQNSYIDPSSQVARDNERYQSLFGGESMIALFTAAPDRSIVDLFSAANRAQLQDVEEQLAANDAVQSVVSPLTLLTWTQDLITSGTASEILSRSIEREPDEAGVALRQQDATITVQRLGAAGEQSFDNPEWVRFLLFGNDHFSIGADGRLVAPADDQLVVRKALRAFIPDGRHAILAAVLVGNASLDEQAVGSDAVQDVFDGRAFEHATVTITGTPTFLTDINDYLQGGMFTLGGIAVIVMVVILVVAFRVRWRLLPLLGMIGGVIWGFGMFGFTGGSLSLVTIAGLPILIGMGIEFSIQTQNRIEEERATEDGRDPFAETAATMVPPMLLATIAAVLAFLTMKISRVPMVQDFGVLLAIGIVALFVAGVVLPMAIVGARERRSPSHRPPREGWVERVVAWLGSLPRGAVIPLVVLAAGLPVLGLVLERGTRIESDPINWANQSSTSIVNARTLERETGFATTLGVFVETSGAETNGIYTDQMGAFVLDLVNRSMGESSELAEASSLATTAAWVADVPGATPLAPTGLDMLETYGQAPAALQELLVAQDGNATQVLFQVGPSSLDERADVLDRVEAAVADPGDGARLPAGASATTGGLAVVGVGLLENITDNRVELTVVALLLVAGLVVLRHRDLVRALLTIIPVMLAVGTSTTLVRLLGVTLSPLTTVSGPLVVATCSEFAILLVARYAEGRAAGLDPEHSTRSAARHTGRAFFASALTTLGGFAVLMFSTLPLLGDFGIVVTINIAVALLAALVVVPPLIQEADRRGLLVLERADADETARADGRRRRAAGLISGALLAAGGLTLAAIAVSGGESAAARPLTADTAEAPATLPPPTTAPPSTVPTTPATTQPGAPGSTVEGETTVPGDSVAPETLPPGPAERPTGLVAGAFWDGLVAAGVDPGVARCAADDLLATTSEADLLAMGIASVPRPAEVNALLDTAAKRCGVTQEQLDAAAAASGA